MLQTVYVMLMLNKCDSAAATACRSSLQRFWDGASRALPDPRFCSHMCTGVCRHSDGGSRTGGHTYMQTLEMERECEILQCQ